MFKGLRGVRLLYKKKDCGYDSIRSPLQVQLYLDILQNQLRCVYSGV